jgi:dihydroorotase-like cyclic amidohydrolase
VTSNPAARLGLRKKGGIAVGMDADLLLFRPGDLELRCH